MLRKFISIVLLLWPLSALALAPFNVSMKATQYGFIDITAEGNLQVSQQDSLWQALLIAEAGIGKQRERSAFTIAEGEISPVNYQALTQLTFIKESKDYRFSPASIEGSVNKTPFETNNQNTKDPLTRMLQMSLYLQQGKRSWDLNSISWNRSKAESYAVIRQGLMNTEVGKLKVTLVEQTQGNRSNERNYFWFADDYGHIPIRWRREEDNKIAYEALLLSGRYDGEPIIGQ